MLILQGDLKILCRHNLKKRRRKARKRNYYNIVSLLLIMNNKNRDLFFNESDDEIVIVTIAPGTSDAFDVEIIAAVEIEELSQEYVAVLPIEPTEDMPEDELILLRYSEDEDGNPEFEGITDDEELESVASFFEQYFDEAANEL